MKNSNDNIENRTRDLPVVAQCLNQLRTPHLISEGRVGQVCESSNKAVLFRLSDSTGQESTFVWRFFFLNFRGVFVAIYGQGQLHRFSKAIP